MEVPHQFHEIGVPITHDGLVPPLEEMARLPIAPIIILGIGELEPLHGPRQRDVAAFHQQMEVIGQQDKGIAGEVIALLVVA